MLYSWSFSHNTAVTIAIKNKNIFSTQIQTLFYLLGEIEIPIKYNITIIFINMKLLKSKHFKSNLKIHHCNHKWYLESLLEPIFQIQCFLFDYFHRLYYHVLSFGYVEGIKYCTSFFNSKCSLLNFSLGHR